MSDPPFPLPKGTHTIVLGAGDVNGVIRGKRFPASNWAATCEEGNAIIAVIFAMDMTSEIWDTPYCSFDNELGFADVVAQAIGAIAPSGTRALDLPVDCRARRLQKVRSWI